MRKLLRIVVVFVVIISFFIGVGCSKYASKEQMAQLETQKNAALAAEKKVADLERVKSDLQRQINEKEKELEKLKADLRAIQQ